MSFPCCLFVIQPVLLTMLGLMTWHSFASSGCQFVILFRFLLRCQDQSIKVFLYFRAVTYILIGQVKMPGPETLFVVLLPATTPSMFLLDCFKVENEIVEYACFFHLQIVAETGNESLFNCIACSPLQDRNMNPEEADKVCHISSFMYARM